MFTPFMTTMTGNMNDFKALIRKVDGQVYEILSHVTCSICHELFNSPVTTNCGHTFCGNCIRRALSNKNNSGCPLCKSLVSRRDLIPDEGKSRISSVCEEFASAFTADVENLIGQLNRNEDDLSGCKMYELGKSKNVKNSGKKGKGPGRPRKSAETIEKINIIDGFVPVVKKDEKIHQYQNKRKEIDDLVSVSQMEERSYVGELESPIDNKLKNVEKVTHVEKIDTWLDKAGENLFNVSNNSLFSESGKIDESCKIVEPINKPSMIRVDYKKEKTNIVNETKDEYEFVASQNTGPKRKRPRKSTSKKKLPDYKAIQTFTKETIKRSQISLTKTKSGMKFDEREVVDETLHDSEKEKSPEPSSDDLLADTIKVPTITASQKFEKLLEETVVAQERKHILYSSNSEESLKCSYESEPKGKLKKIEPVPGCSKDSSDNGDILSDDSCLAKLFASPKEDKKIKQKRKRSNENLPKKHANAPKKRSRLYEVLQEVKDDPGIFCGAPLKDLGQLSKSNDSFADGKEKQENISNLSKSPGWSRVSILKSDFESPERLRRQKSKKKSLNVSGGEKTPMNTSRSSLLNLDVDEKLDCLDVKNGDEYIEDLSQISDFVTGFGTQQPSTGEESFKKMVEAMEEELDNSGDLTLQSLGDKEVEENEEVVEMAKTNNTIIIPETESQESAEESDKKIEIEKEDVEESESSDKNLVQIAESVEKNLVQRAVPVQKNLVQRAESVEKNLVARADPVEKSFVKNPEPAIERFVERRRNRNRNTIPFTLLGKIKKRKRTSTIFLQLGRLAPFLKRSKSTVVKLVFPKGVSYKNKRRTSIGVQTFPETFKMSPLKTSAGIQTSQKLRSESMQTTQREFGNSSAQTTQVVMRSTGVQMTQKNTPLSAGVQTSQIEKISQRSMGVQMTQVDKPLSAGVQTSQINKTAVGVQYTQSLIDEKEVSPKSKDLFPTIPSEAFRFEEEKQEMEEWENIENMEDIKSQPEEKLSVSSTQSKLEKFAFKSKKQKAEEEVFLMDTEIESEFNTTWENKFQKKSQKKLSEFFTPKSNDSDDVVGNRSCKKICRISSQDLSSQEEIIKPEKYEGRQLLPLNIQKIPLSDTIDLSTPEPSQKNTQELVKQVCANINQDLARIKNKEATPLEEVISSQESVKTIKSQICEDSDTDIFVEQTPPKENGSRILDDILNVSVPRVATQHFTPPPVINNLQSSEGTEMIADSIPLRQTDSESFLLLNENFVTPPRATPKTVLTKAPIFKTPHLGFPSKESFFKNKKETEEPDENDENMIKNEVKSVEKTDNVRAVIKSWAKPNSPNLMGKRRICIVSSCCRNGEKIQEFVKKFKVEFSATATKDMTHLVVGLHEEDNLPMCTPKILFAIANKKWVVTEDWIETCLKMNKIVAEEPFESPDSIGGDGCKRARLSKEFLLKDFEICPLGEFQVISKEDFADLVMDCGATVVHHPDKFSYQLGKIRVIVVDRQCLELDVNHIQDLFKKYKTAILYREVIIQAIEGFRLVNFTPYLLPLITEKDLLDLGYPHFLARHEEESECI